MSKRLATVCALLVLAGPALSQEPAALTPPLAYPTGTDETAPASFWPGDNPPPATTPGFWLTGEYLFAWFPADRLPPLITTSPPGTPRGNAGVLGKPSTQILFGHHGVNDSVRSGVRFQTGYWFNAERTIGIEGGTMFLENQTAGAGYSSTGNPILARPFFNVATSALASDLVAFPGVAAGNVTAQENSGNFYEAHLDLTQNFVDKGWFRLDCLVGYRFFRYDEGLDMQTTTYPIGTGFPAGTQLITHDSFGTQNEFNGGDFGMRAHFARGNFSVDFLTKLAIGVIQRRVDIDGETLSSVPGTPIQAQTGGLLALSSNIGRYSTHNTGAVLPEFGLNVGWQALPHLKLRAGYNVLLLDGIARAADQVDLAVNPALVPPGSSTVTGPIRPSFGVNTAEIWIQTLSLGAEFTF